MQKHTLKQFFYNRLGIIVLLVLAAGVGSIFWIEAMMNNNSIIKVSTDFLEHLNNYFAPLGVILSIITIILLYVNFIHQQDEFRIISEASIRANELQLINSQIDYMSARLNEKKYYDGELTFYTFIGEFTTKFNDFKNDNIDATRLPVILKAFDEEFHNLAFDISVMISTIFLLEENIDKKTNKVNLDYKPFINSRLPFQLLDYLQWY
jgi:hypothetical protein